MMVVLKNDLKICIGACDDNMNIRFQVDRDNEHCSNFHPTLLSSIQICSCMLSKVSRKLFFSESEFTDKCFSFRIIFIPNVEVQFGNSDVIIIFDNASCHRSQIVKIISKCNISQMERHTCCPDSKITKNIYF